MSSCGDVINNAYIAEIHWMVDMILESATHVNGNTNFFNETFQLKDLECRKCFRNYM
jgi:hypothetical protein